MTIFPNEVVLDGYFMFKSVTCICTKGSFCPNACLLLHHRIGAISKSRESLLAEKGALAIGEGGPCLRF